MEIDKKMVSNILKILGTYGIIQVLAQDLGIKTGKNSVALYKHTTIYLMKKNKSKKKIE